ncbi:MAG TPA: asparaginase domain-containing protein [Candidatus Saccharimonadales bacterium]|nr:asparaginase domain-containing protein [Candidatus Saccharimonadales bacterium]
MQIKLFLTGGTIDKKYNELSGELDYKKTHIQEMLKQARSRLDIHIEELMLVDSLDMTDSQRQQILHACQSTDQHKIVITHGTDTMVETARLLGENIQDKTIVLFGSMIPFAFGGSDALFNFGAALAAAQTLGQGVYITMNGKIFEWDKVVKNRQLGEFQPR